jgi:hypothetical protein
MNTKTTGFPWKFLKLAGCVQALWCYPVFLHIKESENNGYDDNTRETDYKATTD